MATQIKPSEEEMTKDNMKWPKTIWQELLRNLIRSWRIFLQDHNPQYVIYINIFFNSTESYINFSQKDNWSSKIM